MPRFACPRCKEKTISLPDKYRRGIWLWWPTLAYFTGNYRNLICLLPCWLIIDLVSVRFIPMSCMKKTAGETPDTA